MNPRTLLPPRRADFWLVLLGLIWATGTTCAQPPGVEAGPVVNTNTLHQYYLLGPATWADAEAAAVALGGHLVTINSFDENLWVRDTFANYGGVARDLWIGLHNPNPWTEPPDFANWFGKFEWSSHQPVTTTVWGGVETAPTNTLRSGYCKMRGSAATSIWDMGTWVEEEGSVMLGSVVELPLPLEIILQPQNVSARPGNTALFSISADGSSALDYQWQVGGADLPGQTCSKLLLTNIVCSHEGTYSVRVHNRSGTLTSAPAQLLVTNLIAWGASYDGELRIPAALGSVKAVAAGLNFTLALGDDGKVVGWGLNTRGQTNPPAGLDGVTAIAAGRSHGLALVSNGSVVGWGDNSFGQATAPPGLSNVVAISAGENHSLALRADGTVASWGQGGSSGQWLSNVVSIAAGSYHSLAVLADGYVAAWPHIASAVPLPETVIPTGLGNVVAIAAGAGYSVALKADGTVVAWGTNDCGQVNVPSILTNAVAIRACGNHCLALQPDGTLIGWGSNEYYKNAIPSEASDALEFAAGYAHNLAILDTAAPHVAIEPWDRMFNPGANLVLTAKGAGRQPMQYQWRLGGTNIPGATGDCYNITNAQVSDAGLYSAVLWNALGTNTSRQANLALDPNWEDQTNLAPVLPVQVDRIIEQLTELAITNTAIDPDHSPGFLSYSLLEAPSWVTIDDQGIIHCRPGLLQIPSTNRITTEVVDSGAPPASAQNTFTIVLVPWTNRPAEVLAGPILNPANGHQYFLLDGSSWTNAEAKAVALGGHLVTLNTLDENNWVYSTFGSFSGISRDLWIGLYDPAPEVRLQNPYQQLARYAWSSGQPVQASFENWAQGGPLDHFRTNFAYFKLCGPGSQPGAQGKWADAPGYTPLCSVVELPRGLEIVQDPQSTTTGVGCDATLRIYADGTTPPAYQWQWGGTNLPGETSARLILTNIQFAQSGSYSVLVSNASGTLMSQPAEVSVSAIVTWGSFTPSDDARTNVPAGLTNVSAIAGGYFHDLALKTDGTVAAWGQNLEHQCDVPEGLSNVVGIAAGSGHSMALKNDGTVVAWGTQYGSTTRVPVGLTNVVSIDAGAHNNLALKADGTVVAWGEAYGGQSVAPTWLTNVVAISAGAGHDLALLADGTVIDWNDTTGALNPVPAGLSNAVAISAGELTSLALKADGTVIGWGTGLDMGGSLKIPADLTNAVGISIKWDHSLAMAADGSLVAAWGTNFSGESSVPARLPNVVAIAGGYYHSIALLRDGTPNLTVQPWDRWIRAGTSSAMSAKAVSREPISYQWQSNGTNIPGATTDTLKIANAQPTDTGVYNLAISNQIGTMTSRRAKLTVLTIALPGVTNHPPVLPAQVNWAVYEQIPVQIVNSATDPDGTTNRLTYQLLNPPTGATVDSAGVIRWTPSEEQGPGRIAITTVVTKQCNPPLSATNIFFISVNELNASPSLPLQPSRRIHPLTEMSVTNTGTDPDLPANILRYQLVLAPTGASIDNRGVIRWTPTREQAPSTNWFVTVITDNGQPNLSATNSFAAIVSAPVLSGQPDTTINAGQLLNVTNLAIDNDPVARLTFSLDAAPVGATISSEAGVFSWRAPVDRAGSSNYVLVRVTEDQVPISDARAFSVLVRPLDSTLLQPLGFSNGAFRLRLTGSIGPDYVLEASEGSADWAPLQTNTPNSLPFELIDTTAHSVTNRFYRVRLGP